MKRLFSIVVPVYENEKNLGDTIPRLLALGDQLLEFEVELLFVDDGSTDGSYAVLCEFAKQYPGVVRVVKLTRNFGQTPAIQAGLRFAEGDCVGIISADLQEPCEKFADMIAEWERGAQFVIGEREAREEGVVHQRVSSVYWRLIQRYAFPDFPPLGYDFCLLDKQVVDDINRINEKNSSIFVLIYWLGYRPVRIPVRRSLREKGRSQWRLSKKVGFSVDTLIGFTYLPARIVTWSGLIAGLVCVAYLALVTITWLVSRAAPPGWLTVVGLIALLGAMTLFSLGIITEYLVRILEEARKRPPYVVERTTPGRVPTGVELSSTDETG